MGFLNKKNKAMQASNYLMIMLIKTNERINN
jgi:hypothetical protein